MRSTRSSGRCSSPSWWSVRRQPSSRRSGCSFARSSVWSRSWWASSPPRCRPAVRSAIRWMRWSSRAASAPHDRVAEPRGRVGRRRRGAARRDHGGRGARPGRRARLASRSARCDRRGLGCGDVDRRAGAARPTGCSSSGGVVAILLALHVTIVAISGRRARFAPIAPSWCRWSRSPWPWSATASAVAWADRADPRRTEDAEVNAAVIDPIEATVALRRADPVIPSVRDRRPVARRRASRSRLGGGSPRSTTTTASGGCRG